MKNLFSNHLCIALYFYIHLPQYSNSSLSTGARNEELCNILLRHIFFNVTKLLISIEKKKMFKYYKMFKPEIMSHELQRPEIPAYAGKVACLTLGDFQICISVLLM